MMRSLTTKITIIFCIAFSVVCLLFLTFADIQHNVLIEKTKDRQISATNYLMNLYLKGELPENLEKYFQNFGLRYLKNEKLQEEILENGRQIFAIPSDLGIFESIEYNKVLYLYVKNPAFSVMMESSDDKKMGDSLWIGFILSATVVISLYISVIKNISPLKRLSKNIQKFSAGNLEVKCAEIDCDDEIADLAKEFDKAVCKIRELIKSRQLFLRTIMHELKTPIGKGRIVAEMIDDDLQKSRLIQIFERLELLIDEFAKIEQLISKSYRINFAQYHISEILDQAIDMLMLEKPFEKISLNFAQNSILNVDFSLFSLAIKNLLDNALKYSKDGKVIVETYDDCIIVKNLGDAMDRPIDYYKQAFIRPKNSTVAGMGLGLYIIDKICMMNKFRLSYEYSEGFHQFIIFTKEKNENRA